MYCSTRAGQWSSSWISRARSSISCWPWTTEPASMPTDPPPEQAFLTLQRVEEGLVPQLLERIEHLLARELRYPFGLARSRPLRLVLLARRRDRRTKGRGRVVARRLVEDRDPQLPAHFSVNRPRVK